jgi:predicted GNAT family acetyltransferase
MTDITVRIETTPQGGRYVATVEGREGEAQIVYSTRGPNRISADHTEAPDSLRGTGAALKLVEYMVADARARGFRIEARCPYVAAQWKRHPEWDDAFVAA